MTEVTENKGPNAGGVFAVSLITWVLGVILVVVAFFMSLASDAMMDDSDPTEDAETASTAMLKATHRAGLADDVGDTGVWFVGIGTAGLALAAAIAGWSRVYGIEE